MKRKLLLLLVALLPMVASAYDAQIDGIYYDFSGDNATVTFKEYRAFNDYYSDYSGAVVIPSTVTYNGKTYSVTSIGSRAFRECSKLTSVIIPNSVTSIGYGVFAYCGSLTSITIGNSVTSIGDCVFAFCSSLTSVTIPEGVTSIGDSAFQNCSGLTSITIPNSVTSISDHAFWNCSGLTSITIPEGVTSIGYAAFQNCSGLTSITIPNSVTSIGNFAFSECSGLTSVTIPEGVTSISDHAFSNCSGLTSITIPEGVTSIGDHAFSYCFGLTTLKLPEGLKIIKSEAFSGCLNIETLTIPSTVEFIYQKAFANCRSLSVINVLQTTPPFIYDNTFSNFDVPLKVPAESVGAYRTHDVWKNFKNMEALDGSDIPEPEKCATPTISYNNGELAFACETEGVEFVSEIADTDIRKFYDAKVCLSVTYTITVYSTKAGYEDSDVATATLCWIDKEPWKEGMTEEHATEIKALPVLIQAQAGFITVQGLEAGTEVSAYNTSGMLLDTIVSGQDTATLRTKLPAGATAIVKIGQRAIKVMVK